MRYAIMLASLAVVCIGLAALRGGWWLILVWPGVSLAVISSGYAGLGERAFGKCRDGRLHTWSSLALAPYLLFSLLLSRLDALVSREPAVQKVAPGLWLSRRLRAAQLPGEAAIVVDMTAEFPGCRAICRSRDYRCLPTLDAGTPNPTAFRALMDELEQESRPILVHCASGHGRSAMFIAALMIRRGLAMDIDDAEQQMQKVRPTVKLNRRQRAFLERQIVTAKP